ncbi:sensor histidine kinase [Agromyces sp. G08B096]|uniref:histidine kinase n=1 Tax=Agromyces sp. G08B096 TaxID=3156399 RepID=A0AAU7W5W9_9MICO
MLNRRWWDLAAVAVAVVTVLLSLVDPPYGPSDWGLWATSAAFLVVYAVYLRGRIGSDDPRHHVVITILLTALAAVGNAFEPSFAILQAFGYPFLWITAASTRQAIAGNIAFASSIVVGNVAHSGMAGLPPGLGVAALSLGFSLALGLWITRIAEIGDERAQLLAELQAAQGELAAMHRDAGVTEERGRVAREIHDTIAQSLTGLVMVAQRAGNRLAPLDEPEAAAAREDVALIEDMAREALTEARGLVAALTPMAVDTTLADALGRLASAFERETGVRVTVRSDAPGLGRELEVVLLRSAQEGLANVRKHARARSAAIEVVRRDDGVRLVVEDDGAGPGDVRRAGERGGFGLSGMRDRVALVGGRVSFGPAPGGGARLEVEVPVSRPEGATDE